MLYLNVSDKVMNQWERTIDLYYAIQLGSLSSEIKSVNLLIEEEPMGDESYCLYKVSITVIPLKGTNMSVSIEREHCGDAIEECFAKAKRYMVRRIRGLANTNGLAFKSIGGEAHSNATN